MWDIEQVLNYLKIYAPSSEVSLELFIIETLLSLLTLEAVYVTIGNPAFCLTLYLTGVHFWGELQYVGDFSEQKSSVDQSELEK